MKYEHGHPGDQELLEAADGELPAGRAAAVRVHLEGCWTCRARARKLEDAVSEFVRVHRGELDPLLPPAAGPRALLKARMAALTPGRRRWWFEGVAWQHALLGVGLAAVLVGAAGFVMLRPAGGGVPISVPDERLTPGATAKVTREQVCGEMVVNNRPVPTYLQRKVFAAYGIAGSDPRAYEVDYLITPALGGAEDIHNLWPHSYSGRWNATVKDSLEKRLIELVCKGQVDLTTAQRDIASNWIVAYKKYLHTDEPIDGRQ